MILETIWFVLWGVLWAVYFSLGGFDLGLGSLMPFLTKNEDERRVLLRTVGPVWKGNEVWLVTAGGVTFAAFPGTYAVLFSALYAPLLLVLFCLIMRGVSFEFRSLAESGFGRKFWDFMLFLGSFGPALLFGVAFANIFKGIPLDEAGINHGPFLSLLNPYGLLGGVAFILLFFVHGSVWLAAKSDGELKQRAESTAVKLWPVLLMVAAVFLVVTKFATKLYINYFHHPFLFVLPGAAVVFLIVLRVLMAKKAWWAAWFASCGVIASTVMFGVVGMYPSLLPSSINPAFSRGIYNTASSPMTLKIMLGVTLVFLPVVIAYQIWAYRTFREIITKQGVEDEEAY